MSDHGLFPLASWGRCDNAEADACLTAWGHWLGPCNRPFGVQSFSLCLAGETVAVAVSASTVAPVCGGFARRECVELARLCAHPDHRDLTRVALRLWRVTGADAWAEYWPVVAYVSYANAVRHKGDIYRFDGWTKVAEVPGSGGGGTWARKRPRERKSVWVFPIPGTTEVDCGTAEATRDGGAGPAREAPHLPFPGRDVGP